MRRQTPPPHGYLFLVDVADRMHRDESLLRRLIKQGDLPAYRVGTRWVIAEPVVDLLTHIERPAGRPTVDGGVPRLAWRRMLFETAERLVPPPQAEVLSREARPRCAGRGCARRAERGAFCVPCATGDSRCIEPGCGEESRVRGYCLRHYARRHPSPAPPRRSGARPRAGRR